LINYFQSNIEGELIEKIQDSDNKYYGILLNAAGYSHTSVSIADAVAAIQTEVLEIHISQPSAREKERHSSLLSKYCKGTISGLGLQSYNLGIEYFLNKTS
jgi:3-dehydroquinate dehydratase-2